MACTYLLLTSSDFAVSHLFIPFVIIALKVFAHCSSKIIIMLSLSERLVTQTNYCSYI